MEWIKSQIDETVTTFREMNKRQFISQAVNLGVCLLRAAEAARASAAGVMDATDGFL